jgi:hypothetical protein
MSQSRRILRLAFRVLIGTLLFAQAAFGMRSCVEPGVSAAVAIAARSSHDCCKLAMTELNFCAAQCGDGDRLPGPERAKPHPVIVAGPVITQPRLDNDAAISRRRHLQRDFVADPPPILRFCRFLI